MRRLIIDTATRACSVALFDGAVCIASFYEEIGRGHAERLVPMIAELIEGGRADAIHVDVGPGSFTGIRVGISAARALALAWNATCHGYSCHSLIAAMARNQKDISVDVVMSGGHGEYFFQPFAADGTDLAPVVSLPPNIAAQRASADLIAGDVAESFAALCRTDNHVTILPHAVAWPMIDTLPYLSASPFYGRGADAKLPGGVTP
jgi:tRNA threonylcarbamoyladenosine biosynthesis protein TsaB